MPRVVVDRSLPDLPRVLGDFAGFPEGRTQQQVMLGELSALAKKLMAREAQPFYAMREVARHFGATLGTTLLVYKALEKRGLINRLRSSRTMLVGKESAPREGVRGVVGIPTSLKAIVALPYTRALTTEMEMRLRHLGYVADVIFHDESEENLDLMRRFLRHRLDAIVLHTPKKVNEGILLLREHGVRVLVIERKLLLERKMGPGAIPAMVYLQDDVLAFRKMARRWEEVGIRKIWLWTEPKLLHDAAEVPALLAQFKNIEVELVNDHPGDLLKRIRRRRRKMDTAVAMVDFQKYQACNLEPMLMEEISRVARIGFCSGRPHAPYLQGRGTRVDIVDYNATEIAARLAEDVGHLSVLRDGIRHTFQAEYYDQVTL